MSEDYDSKTKTISRGDLTDDEINIIKEGINVPIPEMICKFNNEKSVSGKVEFYKENNTIIKFRLINKPNFEFVGKILGLSYDIVHKDLNENDRSGKVYLDGDGSFVIETKDKVKMVFTLSEVDHETIMPESINPMVNLIRPLIPISTRVQVFARDNHTCQYKFEGCTINKDLEIDHIIPICLGGASDLNNLITSCSNCNKKKGSKIVF